MEVAEADPAAGPPASPKPMPAETAPDLYGEALALYAEGSFTEAAEKLKPLLSGSLQEAGAAALLARIFADRGRLTEAFDLCERAVGADRCNASYRYLLATVLQELGRLEDAAAELRKTLYLDQDFVLAHILLGNFALNSGERKESARHFRNALTLLRRRQSEELVPGAEGLTAGRLMEIIMSTGFEDVA
jgi:chemotaxis protein methyltransferase CheR